MATPLTAAEFDAAVAAGWLYATSLNQPQNLVPPLPNTILNYPSIKLMTDSMYFNEFGSNPTSAISEANFQTLYDDADNGLQTVSVVLLDFEQAGLRDDETEIATTLDNARAVFGAGVRIGWYVSFGFDPGASFTTNTQAQSNALADTHEAAWGDKADFITLPTYRYTADSYVEYGRRQRQNMVALARMTPACFCWIGMNDNEPSSPPYPALPEQYLSIARTLAMELTDGILLWFYGQGTGNGYPFTYSNNFDQMFAEGPDTTSELGAHYDEATLNSNPTETVRDAKLMVDLSDMSQRWWDNVASDGSDIRMVTNTGTRLPFQVLEIDAGAQTGKGILRIPGEITTAPTIRCHCGSGVSLDTWHEHAARAVWADGTMYRYYYDGHTDATPEGDDATVTGGANGTGPIGTSLTLDGSSTYAQTPDAIDLPVKPWVVAAAIKPTAVASTQNINSLVMSETQDQLTELLIATWSTPTNLNATSRSSGTAYAPSPTDATAGEWQTVFGIWASNTSRYCGRNGVRGSEETTSKSSFDADSWIFGARYNPPDSEISQYFGGDASDWWLGAIDPGDGYFELWHRTLITPSTAFASWTPISRAAKRVVVREVSGVLTSVAEELTAISPTVN